ncbi:MAG: electron transport complex protein RnfG [Alphaproteobacteria bacterium]|jgi:electron transport complex protein RnfG
MNTIQRNGLILGGFALVTTSIIALTYSFTAQRIEQAKERQLLSTLNQVVGSSMHDNELHTDCVQIEPNVLLGNKSQRVFRSRLGGNNTALIIETTAPDGYSGAIDLVVAIDPQNTVLAARVINHKETPGLGDKIELRVSDWILSFNNVIYDDERISRWAVRKDGGQFDQFTGATITPRSVVNAIKNAAIYGQTNMQTLFTLPTNCQTGTVASESTIQPESSKDMSSE